MGEITKKRLKVTIIEDEDDILTLYNDYLSGKGYEVINRYKTGDDIMTDLEKQTADVYVVDYRLAGKKSGTDVAVEILDKFPSAPILFISAYEPMVNQISKNPAFYNKNVDALVKPVKLDEIERKVIDMANKR
jgi:DNA-binding NtrC family response regulator